MLVTATSVHTICLFAVADNTTTMMLLSTLRLTVSIPPDPRNPYKTEHDPIFKKNIPL